MKNYNTSVMIFMVFICAFLVSCPQEPGDTVTADYSYAVYVNDVLVDSFPYTFDFGSIPVFQVSDPIEVRVVNTSADDFYGLQVQGGYEITGTGADDFILRYGEYTTDSHMPISPIGSGEATYLYFAYNPRNYGSSSAEIQIPLARNIGETDEDEDNGIVLYFTGKTATPSDVGDIFHFLEIPSSSSASYSTPSYHDGSIFIGTSLPLAVAMASDNCFCRLDEDLTIQWETDLGSAEVLGGAAFDSTGDVYFVVRTNRGIDDVSSTELFLKKLDGDTGEVLFTKDLPAFRVEIGVVYWNPAIANTDTSTTDDDVIYVGGGNLRAYQPDGTLLWEYNESTEPFMALKGIRFDGDGNIYALGLHTVDGSTMLHVMSFDADRNRLWDFESEVWGGVGTLAFNYDYSRVYAPLARRMYCIDNSGTGSDGTKLWEYQTTGDYESMYIPVAPVVDKDGYVYFSTKENSDSIFYSLNADGSLRWSFPLYGDGYPSPVLGSAGVLYIGSEMLPYDMTGNHTVGETLRAINPATGEKIWGTQLSKDCCHSHPLLLTDGMLYIAATMLNSEHAIIYAVKTESASGYAADAGNACFMDASNRSGSRER